LRQPLTRQRVNKRGKCVVFNYELFTNPALSQSKGTVHDRMSLERTFCNELGFEFVAFDDLTYAETDEKLNKSKFNRK